MRKTRILIPKMKPHVGQLVEAESLSHALKKCAIEGQSVENMRGSKVDFSGENLAGISIGQSNFRNAIFTEADLHNSEFVFSDFTGADFTGADLRRSVFSFCILRDAVFTGANLFGANFARAINIPDHVVGQTSVVPEGEFIAWKMCARQRLVRLRIPRLARRSNATTRKCRADQAWVEEILDLMKGGREVFIAHSIRDGAFLYHVGHTVECHEWDDNRFSECSGGIHFYLTRDEALQHIN